MLEIELPGESDIQQVSVIKESDLVDLKLLEAYSQTEQFKVDLDKEKL